MPIEFANNATSLLDAPALADDTHVTIEAEDAWMFPVADLGTGEYFYATIEDRRIVPTRREIVKVIDASGALFTVVRGQDNTVAEDFYTGAIFSHRLNAAALRDLIAEEAAARMAADAAEAAIRAAADADLQAQITAEVAARVAGDASLQSQLNAEIDRAQDAEANLQAQINGITSTTATKAELDAERNRALAAEAALGVRIDNETAARIAADNALGVRIDNETAARIAADANLQAQIDALGGSSGVPIVQSGVSVIPGSSSFVTVTFPTAYAAAPVVVVTVQGAGLAAIYSLQVEATATNFVCHSYFPGGDPIAVDFNWIATGTT